VTSQPEQRDNRKHLVRTTVAQAACAAVLVEFFAA